MTHEPAIELKGVGMWRGGRWILSGINWSVESGACAAVLGPNGSGKSTLARVLACHMWPTAGESVVLGAKFGEANLPEVRHDIRLVQPAGPYDIDPALTAKEAVLTGFFGTIGLYDAVTGPMQAEAVQLLEQVGLHEVVDHPYSTLSSGERVRSLIARAIVRRPKLLILDEPTAGLDLLAREQVLATVQGLFDRAARTGETPPTVVMITHHVEELPPATSHVLLLQEGRAVVEGPPRDVLTGPRLSRVYGCPVEVTRNNGRYYLQVHPGGWEQLLARRG